MSLSDADQAQRGRRRLQSAISTASRTCCSPERSMEIQRLLGSRHRHGVRRAGADQRDPRPVQAEAMERSMRWAERSRERLRSRAASMPQRRRAVRHPAGRAGRGAAQGVAPTRCSTSGSTAMRWAAWRWARARRRCSACSICAGPARSAEAALPDGRGQARRHRRRRGARHRHVRLRAARPAPAAPARPSPATGPINIRNAKFAEDQGRSIPPAPAPSAPAGAAPISTISSAAGEILGRDADDRAQLWFYQRLMQGLRDAIAEGPAGGMGERISRALLRQGKGSQATFCGHALVRWHRP